MAVTVRMLRELGSPAATKKLLRSEGEANTVKVLTALNNKYRDGTPLIDDALYNMIYDAALDLFPEAEFFQTAGGGTGQDDVQLEFYMSSRTKFKDAKWSSIQSWVGSHDILVAAKKDGIALQLGYDDGELVFAATQGKTGHTGKNVLHLLLKCPNVPHRISLKKKIFIRCEGIFPTGVSHETLGITEGRGGRRNVAAGILNRVKATSDTKSKLAHLEVIGLQVFGSKLHLSDQYVALRKLGFKVPPHKVIPASELTGERLHNMLVSLKKISYECDGLVLTYNDVALKVETAGNPAWSMAYKESDETTQMQTEVIGVTWEVGKTGVLAPTIKTKPVRLGDITASSFSGFNAEFILTGKRLKDTELRGEKDKPIGVGATLLVERSGDVIPYIVKVITGAKKPALPDFEYEKRGANFYVEEEHSQQTVNKIIYALRALGVKGAADSLVSQLVAEAEKDGNSDAVDVLVLVLTDKELWEKAVGGSRAKTVFADIQSAVENASFATYMDASGVFQHLGTGRARDFAQAYPQLGELLLRGTTMVLKHHFDIRQKASELYRMPQKTADEIADNWNLFVQFVKLTRGHGWSAEKKRTVSKRIADELPMRGKVVYITGVRLPDLAEKIRQAGGEVQSSFNAKKCNLLVAKDINASATEKKRVLLADSAEVISVSDLVDRYGL